MLAAATAPPLLWVAPFGVLLLCIGLLPLIPRAAHWWHANRNKLFLSLGLALITLVYYSLRPEGVELHAPFLANVLQSTGLELQEHEGHLTTAAGGATAAGALANALQEYVPFIVLLFALYYISGGIVVRGDIPALPRTNAAFLALGTLLASVIGTTGASMLLIRPLLSTNSERKHVAHTVVFFIFMVSNVGGLLLPIGDPPLLLGYLRGVPFLWTLRLWPEWLFVNGALLAIYFAWDSVLVRRETRAALALDRERVQRLQVSGTINLALLGVVVLAIATLDPTRPIPGTNWAPWPYLREAVLLLVALASRHITPRGLRATSGFNLHAIAEVAALFIGIFITMQPALELLHARGAELGLRAPWQFFWATGGLSALLDNAPTYLVFLETATTLPPSPGAAVVALTSGSTLNADLLRAISLGAVLMGALTVCREWAELYGQKHRRGAQCPDAELLRVHALQRTRPPPALCTGNPAVPALATARLTFATPDACARLA